MREVKVLYCTGERKGFWKGFWKETQELILFKESTKQMSQNSAH